MTDLEIEQIAQQIEEYASKKHQHRARVVWDHGADGYVDKCAPLDGDRCDITAAYNNAAAIVRANKKGNQ